MKFADLKPGDRLTDFEFWGCIPQYETRTVITCDDGLYVECSEGRHYLNGQTGDDGELVGCEKCRG